jgi:hypothetical protein
MGRFITFWVTKYKLVYLGERLGKKEIIIRDYCKYLSGGDKWQRYSL